MSISQDCRQQLDEFYNSDISKVLEFRLKNKYKGENKPINLDRYSEIFKNGTSLLKNINVDRQFIIEIGHFFGHNFKPWEAVKWVKGINFAGKALGTFGVICSIYMQHREEIGVEKQQQIMRQNRENIRAAFNDAAKEMTTHLNHALEDFLDENYRASINSIDKKISLIRENKINKLEKYKLIEKAQDECLKLINEIHRS